MIPFSMKHLRYFDALARLGHFGRAAEECAISQPALSVQIKEMEDLVGAPLVERTPRQIRLTALGEAFAARVHEILRSVDALEGLVQAARAPFMGQLRLGAIPTVAPYLLPALVAELAQTYPGLDLRPREAITQKLLEDLMDGRLDAAIVALPVSEASLHEMPLFEEEFVLVRPPADAGKPVPAADKLWQMRLLLLEEGHCFREQALAFCKLSAAEAPHNMMEGSSLSTLVQMVGAGIGITLVPEMALGVETRSARIALSRLAPPRPNRTIGMIWRRSHPLAGELRAVGEIVHRIGENMRLDTARLLQEGGS